MRIAVKEKSRSFASGAVILATAGMVSKLLGAIYRIPLTNILGAEGIGLYQLVFPIYALMLTLSSSGIPTAISRLVSEKKALNDNIGKYKILKTSWILLLVSGGVAMLIMYLLGSPLAKIQGNSYIKYGYYAIAPSILIVAGSSFFKGWFQGNMNMAPTASAQIVEQVSKMIFGLLFAKLLLPKGLIYAVSGALIGLTLSELVSLVIIAIMFVSSKDFVKQKVNINLDNAGELIKISVPIALSGLIFPLMQFVDSMLIVNLLKYKGVNENLAISQYGLLSGTVNSLINMPVVITLALAVAIVPVVASKRMHKDVISIKDKSNMAIKLAYVLGIPCFVGILILARPIVNALYPSLTDSDRATATGLLMLASISVIVLSSLQIYTSLLQALGKTMQPVRNLGIAAVIKILMDIFLILTIGIYGACLASVVAYIVAMALNSASYKKLLGRKEKFIKTISKIVFASVIMGLIIWLIGYAISNIYVKLAVCVIAAVVIYLFMILIMGVMTEEELMGFPFGSKLAKLSRIIRRNKE